MKRLYWFALMSLCVSFLGSGELLAEVKDHPVIKPIPGSTLDSSYSEYTNYDAYNYKYEQDGQNVESKVKGKHWKLDYQFLKEDGNRDESVSVLEILENYKQAALEKGGEILKEGDRDLIFTLISEGKKLWVHLKAGSWKGWYQLNIIEEKGFVQKLVFGADEIKKQLDEKGHVAIYGILFDVDKASLKQESEKPLQEIVKLMRNYPGLQLEIQGHTDNQGASDYNLDLSQRRAETVKAYLVASGIDDSRLAAKGYGLSQPVATNDTEEGRAKNRRVELVRKETLKTGQVVSGDKESSNVSGTDFAALVNAAEKSNGRGDRIEAVEYLKKAILSIWDEVPLTARNIRLVSNLEDYTSKKDNLYREGETIYITSQVFGHKLKKIGDSYQINITTDFLVFDETGKVLGGQEGVYKFDHTSPIPNTEFSLDLTYTLTGLASGTYKIQTKINDKNSAKSTTFENIIKIK